MASATAEPFPSLPLAHDTKGIASPLKPSPMTSYPASLERTSSSTPTRPQRSRTSSLSQAFLNSNPPYGMWQATGEVASKVPTLGEIRNGSFCAGGWTEEGQMEGRGETPHQIQRRRTSRASSISASRRRKSTTSPLSSAVDEREEYFPSVGSQVADEANRVPFTIPEANRTEIPSTNM
jgi:hypothetical protein